MLVDYFVKLCTKREKKETPDGEGGSYTTFRDGQKLEIAIVKDRVADPIIADRENVLNTYTLTYKSGILKYHDIIKRDDDGRTFLIITSENDSRPPALAGFDFKQVKAVDYDEPSI